MKPVWKWVSKARSARLHWHWTAGATAAVVGLVACGGGGGGSGSSDASSDPQYQQRMAGDGAASAGPALMSDSANAFSFSPRSTATTGTGTAAEPLATPAAATAETPDFLRQLFTGWNPRTSPDIFAPGLKVMFFGQPEGCAANAEGPTAPVASGEVSQVTRVASADSASRPLLASWTPINSGADCPGQATPSTGPSKVVIHGDDSGGSISLLTSTGPQTGGGGFLQPFHAEGQDGHGGNAHISGTFVGYRQPIFAPNPLRPWLDTGTARVQSVQSLGTWRVNGSSADTVQVKQQLIASFFNPTCFSERRGKPCQAQYLLHSAIVRNGVDDWATQAWFLKANVWFDAVQGGVPIVTGPLYAPGQTTSDGDSGLPLWTSQGSATQHQTFGERTFDIRIRFEELKNMMRIVAARDHQTTPLAVTADELAATWGSRWDDPAAWTLLDVSVGQEVYNPDAHFRAEIAGSLKSIYIGPQ